jgi:hypothetical protein
MALEIGVVNARKAGSVRGSSAGRVAFAIALAIVLLGARAGADEPGTTTAEALFREGRALIAKRDYAAACPKLEESLRLDPAPGTRFNLARCYELEGRLASAWTAYSEVADAMAIARERGRERVARERLADIEPRLSYVLITVDAALPAPVRDTLRVTLDGREVRASDLGGRLAVDLGEHVVVVVAEGKRTWEQHVQIRADAETSRVQVPPLEDEPARQTASASAPAPATRPSVVEPAPATSEYRAQGPVLGGAAATGASGTASGLGPRRIVALTLFGASAVAAGIGTYFGVSAFELGAESRRDGCIGGGCPPGDPNGLSATRDSHTAGDASTVSFAVCGAFAAGGLILWLTGSSSVAVAVAPGPDPRAAAPRAAPGAAPGLSLQGRF